MSPYEVLGVAPSATPGELRRAYLALVRRHHPDTGGDPDAMRRVNAAWSVLGDPRARAAYDRSRTGPAAAPASSSQAHVHEEDQDGTEEEGFGSVVVPRWAAMLPVALLGVAAVAIAGGLLVGWGGLVAGGVTALLLAGALFVAMPFLALAGARRGER